MESGPQRPAPGVADEGSGDGALGIEDFLVGNVARMSATTNPVMPPSTKARQKMPYEAMPLASDPTSSGSIGETKLQSIPEKPVEAEPKPPVAPWLTKTASQENGKEKKAEDDQKQCSSQTMKETNLAPASVNSQGSGGQTQESARCLAEGSQVMGSGWYPGGTYNEVWSWICAGKININGILIGSDLMGARALNFMNWMHRMRQVV